MRRWISSERVPPLPQSPISWRSLYERGAFFQRELFNGSNLRREVTERGWLFFPLGNQKLQQWHEAGALRPIAFARAPYFSGTTMPAIPADEMAFVEESGFRPWKDFEFQLEEKYATVSEQYTPWQVLTLGELLDDRSRDAQSDLADAWDPALKLLVLLQNRYWPQVRGRGNVLTDASGVYYDPLEREGFEPGRALTESALTPQDIVAAYTVFACRALALEPEDGLFLVRQMLPRTRRQAFKGVARRGQDFCDAAEMMRLFYADLTGEVLPDVEVVAEAHSRGYEVAELQDRRSRFFEHEPRIRYDADDARKVLLASGLYPYGIHVVVEGQSEQIIIERITRALAGPSLAQEVMITNLRGVGEANKAEQLMASLSNYVARSVLLIDDEGEMSRVVRRLINEGRVDESDVGMADPNLEEHNFTPAELVAAAIDVAATPSPKRDEGAVLKMTEQDLREAHAKRLAAAGNEKPGMAGTLEKLTTKPEHGPAQVLKKELAGRLAEVMLAELEAAKTVEARDDLYKRRPVLKHVVKRIVDPLFEAPLDRPRRRIS